MDNFARKNEVLAITKQLEEHKADNICLLDLDGQCSFSDYFIIATVRSRVHMNSLKKHLAEYFKQADINILNSLNSKQDSGWILIDGGYFVIHLMEHEKRRFYELEKLWFKSKMIYHSS